MLLAICTICL